MPALDGTGPAGLGPMTGRGLGWCSGYLRPYGYYGAPYYRPYGAFYYPPAPYTYWGAYAPYYGYGRGWGWFGRGFGFGRGWGRGWRWWW